MLVEPAVYDRAFYDAIRPGTQASAAVVVPMAMERIDPRRIIDIGCGEGWWAKAFADHGCEVVGVDGAHVAEGQILGERFVPHDIALPLPGRFAGRFDLAICLEVAEHLPGSRAASFVTELCALAPAVLFSAAIPHQSGAGHVNLQWPSYWVALFADHGYDFDGSIRWEIWNRSDVEPWYAQNLHLATRGGTGGTVDVVHPTIHEWGRQ